MASESLTSTCTWPGNVGLGMWIAQGIVKLHQVRIQSNLKRSVTMMVIVNNAVAMVPQGSFNLYSDGIDHGCRLVAELPLYSYPTTPLTDGDQIQFSSIFRAWEEHGDDEEEGSGTGITGGEEMMVTDVLPFTAFLDDESQEIVGSTPQLPVVEIDNNVTVDTIPIFSQFQEIPFLEELSGQAQESVSGTVPEKERLHSTSKANYTSYSSRSKVFPDAAIAPSDDLNETKSSDSKAKPPPERVVVAAGDSAGKCSDGLRFLIVVRWLSAGRSCTVTKTFPLLLL